MLISATYSLAATVSQVLWSQVIVMVMVRFMYETVVWSVVAAFKSTLNSKHSENLEDFWEPQKAGIIQGRKQSDHWGGNVCYHRNILDGHLYFTDIYCRES